ncbi:MAG: EscU/YscU/HrcU family type III secretion system export apparatus switch protein [Polyangiales bacterium]
MTEASPERIRRARARGEVALSHRLTASVSIAFGLAALTTTLRLTRDIFDEGLGLATRAAAGESPLSPGEALLRAVTGALSAMAPTLAATALGLALAHAIQTRFLVTWPDRDAAPPIAPGEALVTALWVVTLLSTACVSVWSLAHGAGLAAHDLATLTRVLTELLSGVAWRLTAASLALGALELAWRRARYLDALRPTRDEALREQRENEGDPRARSERRQRMRG